MEKQIEIGGKKLIVRELLAKEVDTINFEDKADSNKKQVMMSTGMTAEEYDKVTWKERTEIFKAINEVNGIKDFLPPVN
jgi:hypothetical protein